MEALKVARRAWDGAARRVNSLSLSAALIVSAGLVAASILFIGRWEAVAGGGSYGRPLLLDRWTGTVVLCRAYSGQRHLDCETGLAE